MPPAIFGSQLVYWLSYQHRPTNIPGSSSRSVLILGWVDIPEGPWFDELMTFICCTSALILRFYTSKESRLILLQGFWVKSQISKSAKNPRIRIKTLDPVSSRQVSIQATDILISRFTLLQHCLGLHIDSLVGSSHS